MENNTKTYETHLADEKESEAFALRFSRLLSAPLVVGFSGEIGAGKTTIIRALLRSLGEKGRIKSPTFSLVESYQTTLGPIYHFDLYRIHDEMELEYIGFRDYFKADAICLIEWPERVFKQLQKFDMILTLSMVTSGRHAKIEALTPAGCQLLARF